MAQRGRPRHPDVLTPREWEVLSLLREGLSNPQIGERLGISADAAKYHVSEILSKLGVATREEAAAWQPEPAKAQVLRPAWARAIGNWPLVARIALGLASTAAIAGVVLLAWGVLRSSGESGSAVQDTGTPTASASASATPRPVAVQPGDVISVLGSTEGVPSSTGGPVACDDIFRTFDSDSHQAVRCTVGADAPRLKLVDVGNGILRLDAVELVLLGNPDVHGPYLDNCSDLLGIDALLSASADPAAATEQIACSVPVRSQNSPAKVWAHVNPDATVQDNSLCWWLAPAAGGVGDGVAQKPVQCFLYLPGTPTPTPTAPPSLTYSAPVDLPLGTSLVVQLGGGETPLYGLERVTASGDARTLFYAGERTVKGADGSYSQVTDFEANGVTLPTPVAGAQFKGLAEEYPYVNSTTVSDDGSTMFVGLCVRGQCGGGAVNDNAQTQIYRSTDGGESWSQFELLDSAALLVAVGSDGRVLVDTQRPDVKAPAYTWEPGGEPVSEELAGPLIAAARRNEVSLGDGTTVTAGFVGGVQVLLLTSGTATRSYGVPGLETVGGVVSPTQIVGVVNAS